MKNIIPHFSIQNCKEEISFYKNVFGGEIRNAQLSDGIEVLKGHEGKYIHAELHINSTCILYFCDVFNEISSADSEQMICLELESDKEIERMFASLSEDGEVCAPLGMQMWGAKYGSVRDRNGLHWELNFPQ